MKKINKIFCTILFISVLSCETIELEKTIDPFSLTPGQLNVEFTYNAVVENFVRQIEGDADFNDNWSSGGSTNGDGLSLFGAELTRVYAMTNTNSINYNSVYQNTDVDDEWFNFYIGILNNIRALEPKAISENKLKHVGICQFIEAYSLVAMVDFFGDVPYSEALQGSANFSPKVDSGASLYETAITLLDKAIVNFGSSSVNPNTELFYNNNYTNWIKAANTLKMKIYLQKRLVDNTAITKFNNIVTSGNFITNSSEDFVYKWGGTSASNPDNRHPRFGINYTANGASDYMSNWLMGTMNSSSDPRIRYYFYRQKASTPGNGSDPNEEDLQCSLQTAPAHYLASGYTFCNLPDGYWGRDHGDNGGTPPDGLKRTTFGVYPAGGRFDGNNFAGINATAGAKGKGITPILLASWVDFMRAEVALVQNQNAIAKQFLLNGINKSIANVISFGPNDPGITSSFVPTATAISAYVSNIDSSWDSASANEKWNIFGTQFFIASFGNGIESYNFYRRTGYPTRLQPNRSANPGTFVRSLYYPADAVNNNSKIVQKANQSVPVFWNTNASPNAN
jgi:hypothetical protein